MTPHPPSSDPGLFGDGRVCGPDGAPLRPGGLGATEALLDRAAFPDGALIVDVGCGQGASVATMLHRGLVGIGVDRERETLKLAHDNYADATFVLGEADALPFDDASIDGVLAECSLSTMTDRRRVLGEWFRVLKPGGRLALGDVYRRAAETDAFAAATDVCPFADWRHIARDLERVGFRVEWFEDRSDVLAEWVGRFIFAHGSLEALWGGSCGFTMEAVRAARPGYYLAVADRPSDSSSEDLRS